MQIRKKGSKYYFLRSKYFTEGVGPDRTKRSMAVVIGSAAYLGESAVKFHPDSEVRFTDAEAQQWRDFIAANEAAQRESSARYNVDSFGRSVQRFHETLNAQPDLLSLEALEGHQEALRSLMADLREMKKAKKRKAAHGGQEPPANGTPLLLE